jgi:2-dehydro-3-deoxyglucarate aldolase/4-hydroxy-2-oxoheptanedioate aldolase
MIPMVESPEQARGIVQACRYPPVGRRGAGFGFAQCDYLGGDVGQKVRIANERTLVVAQIETERGLAAVEEIAAVDGIDVLWVGHFDLSNFMGMPAQFDNPTFLQAMQHVADVARRHGKAAGFMATDPAWVDRAKAMGYTMLAVGTDVSLLADATKRLVDHAAAPTEKKA